MNTISKTICFNKYSKPQFLTKEAEIRRATYYENEAPTTLDFLMFYLRFLKRRVQVSMEYRPEIDVFLQDLQTIAYDLSKSLMIDASLLKYKPSILSITLVNLGF